MLYRSLVSLALLLQVGVCYIVSVFHLLLRKSIYDMILYDMI